MWSWDDLSCFGFFLWFELGGQSYSSFLASAGGLKYIHVYIYIYSTYMYIYTYIYSTYMYMHVDMHIEMYICIVMCKDIDIGIAD